MKMHIAISIGLLGALCAGQIRASESDDNLATENADIALVHSNNFAALTNRLNELSANYDRTGDRFSFFEMQTIIRELMQQQPITDTNRNLAWSVATNALAKGPVGATPVSSIKGWQSAFIDVIKNWQVFGKMPGYRTNACILVCAYMTWVNENRDPDGTYRGPNLTYPNFGDLGPTYKGPLGSGAVNPDDIGDPVIRTQVVARLQEYERNLRKFHEHRAANDCYRMFSRGKVKGKFFLDLYKNGGTLDELKQWLKDGKFSDEDTNEIFREGEKIKSNKGSVPIDETRSLKP